jgi:hypothetical protein
MPVSLSVQGGVSPLASSASRSARIKPLGYPAQAPGLKSNNMVRMMPDEKRNARPNLPHRKNNPASYFEAWKNSTQSRKVKPQVAKFRLSSAPSLPRACRGALPFAFSLPEVGNPHPRFFQPLEKLSPSHSKPRTKNRKFFRALE